MKSRHVTVLFAVGLLVCGAVKAAEPSVPDIARVKGSMEVAVRTQEPSAGQRQKLKKGDVCWTRGLPTEVWNCSFLGGITVSQVYDRGWRVVDMSVGGNGSPAFLVIEEQ